MKKLQKTFTRQHDQSDCGVAALLSVIRFHGGTAHLEHLRELSGTSKQGTTLLGIFQAAQKLGFTASALQADGIISLQEYFQNSTNPCINPCILHILKEERLQHYIVCYGYDAAKDEFLIGDPAHGITTLSARELETCWQSKALLRLTPNDQFIRTETVQAEKRRWVRELIEGDVTVLAVAFAMGIVIALLSLSTAIFTQKLVDTILPKHDMTRLWTGLAMLAALLLARNGLNFLRGRFVLRQTQAFNNRVTNRFFSTLLRLPQSFFDNRKTGDLIARMNDAQRLQQALTYLVGEVMIDALLFLVSISVIFLYSVPIGAFLLGSVGLYVVLAWRFHAPIVGGQQAVMGMYGVNQSNYVDTIQGIAAIKSSQSEAYFAQKTRTIYGAFQEKVLSLGNIGTLFSLQAEIVGVVIICTVLTWSSVLVVQGVLLTGALVAIIQMTSQLNAVSVRLAVTNLRLQEARIAFERMYAFASVQPEFIDEESTDAGEQGKQLPAQVFSISMSNVAFRFPGRTELLKDVRLELRRGEIVALKGESGSGKTTILQMLQRLYAWERGEVVINENILLENIGIKEWRGIVAVVPQHIKIFNGTVIENICLAEPNEKVVQDVIAFCREYGFDQIITQFPQGYATLVGEEGVNLSGGQRQILALARALYQQPQMLLLDECTSALDRVSEERVLHLLRQCKHSMAILMITHRTDNLDIADRVYTLKNGTVAEEEVIEI